MDGIGVGVEFFAVIVKCLNKRYGPRCSESAILNKIIFHASEIEHLYQKLPMVERPKRKAKA